MMRALRAWRCRLRATIAAGIAAALLAGGVTPAPASVATPRVQILVAGRTRLLHAAAGVGAGPTSVRAGRRTCRIAGATPLAALAALGRIGGPAFTLHDYGRCGQRVGDAAGLYVRRIGPDAATGPNGWVYKVRRKVPGAAAADPSGMRLRAGERLLWFYCHMGSHGCQRTLELSLPAVAGPGAALPVSVRGYDDQGRGVAIAGATITLAGATAQTGPDGTATIAAPVAAGRYSASATAPGLVASFPSPVRIG